MASLPIWLKSHDKGRAASLTTCRNCGKVAALSNPCGFSHLGIVMAFADDMREQGWTDKQFDLLARAIAVREATA